MLGVLTSKSTPLLLQLGGLVDVGEAVRAPVVVNFVAVVELAGDAVGRVVDGDALDLAVVDHASRTRCTSACRRRRCGHTVGRANDDISTAKSTGMIQRGQPLPIGRRAAALGRLLIVLLAAATRAAGRRRGRRRRQVAHEPYATGRSRQLRSAGRASTIRVAGGAYSLTA